MTLTKEGQREVTSDLRAFNLKLDPKFNPTYPTPPKKPPKPTILKVKNGVSGFENTPLVQTQKLTENATKVKKGQNAKKVGALKGQIYHTTPKVNSTNNSIERSKTKCQIDKNATKSQIDRNARKGQTNINAQKGQISEKDKYDGTETLECPYLTLNGTHIQHVTELDVSDNGITSLDVTSLQSLTSLNCSNNAIVTVSIHGAALISLDAHMNRVTSIRVKSHPRRLQSLNVDTNSLGSVPPWLVSCNQLEYCDVSNNTISNLPAYVTSGHLGALRVLRANHNRLQALSSTQGLAEDSLSAFERRRTCPLEILSLHHNNVNSLSQNFFANFATLRVLNISSNNLKKLPELIRRPEEKDDDVINPSLQEIYAGENEIENLAPIEICQSLRVLHVPFNSISVLTQSLCLSCELLEELILSGNNLTSLPSAVSRLKRLNILKVHLNPIQQLPRLSHLTNLKVIDASHCRLGKVDFSSIVSPSLTSLDIAFNPSLVVDRHQFSKCKSERPVSVVNTANEKGRSFPFQEANSSHRNPDKGKGDTNHFDKKGGKTSSGNMKVPNEKGSKNSPWKIGFCEAIGREGSRLPVAQLRLSDLCGDGRIGLVALADGGESVETASSLLTSFPEAFQEESICSPDLNDALRYSVLSCLRKIVVEEKNLPSGFCSAYLEEDRRRNEMFNMRSSARSFNSEKGSCSLRLCCFGDIKAVVTTSEGPPLVVSSSSQYKSNEDPYLSHCKLTAQCSIDRISHLPDPHTSLVRLNHTHRSLIIGSSNLWELIDPKEANRICQDIHDPSIAAKRLLTLAESYGSRKSLSILIVYLPCGSPRNSHQYSSMSEKKINSEHRDHNQKVIPLHNYSHNQDINKRSSKNESNFFPNVNPRETKDMVCLDRYPPSGQSDNEESNIEISLKNKVDEELHEISAIDNKETKKQLTYFNYPTTFGDYVPHSIKTNEPPSIEDSSGYFASSCDLITPPAGFGDSDTESIGSDSGFSGNSEGKINNCNLEQHDKSSNASQISEEQFRSWEYVVARNTKILYQQELNSLTRKKKDLCSLSVPNLNIDSSTEDYKESTSSSVYTEEDIKNDASSGHLNFHRNVFRKSRLARGAFKLLQNKFNLGNRFKIGTLSNKLRCKHSNFKRFGSLQNLKYYQNNRPWSNGYPSITQPTCTEPSYTEEMREKSIIDCVELESRMQHYWNTGVTCF